MRSDRRSRPTDVAHKRAENLDATADLLIGRDDECRRIDTLLAGLRARRSATLVITGLAGIGKTSVLRYAMARARDIGVVHAVGLETETGLPFRTLACLLEPFAHRIAELPAAPRAALSAALGLGSVDGTDRLTVGSATLSCLALAAEDRPLLVVVDDGQWVDPSSAEALLFACRRLDHEGVGVLISLREGAWGPFVDAGLDTLHVEGLRDEDARRLVGHDTAPEVAEHIVASTGGHPLAILELGRVMSERQRSGAEPLPDPLPACERLEHVFASRVDALSDEARALLVLASANVGGEVGVLTAACDRVGIGKHVLDEVRGARLVDLTDNRLLFVHPLMRSVVYQLAPEDPRREAHRVLADSLRREGDRDRRAWHLAAAAAGADERAADALEQAATGARGRGAFAVAGDALQRAAELSPRVEDRARRLVDAGDAFWRGGQSARAARTFGQALSLTVDPLARADIRLRTGAPEALVTPLPSLREELLRAADEVRDLDPGRAGLLMAQASLAALTTGDVGEASAAAEDAVRLTVGMGLMQLTAALVLALAQLARGDMQDARAGLDSFVALIDSAGMREELFGVGESIANALMWVDRFADARRLLDGMVNFARERSAPGMLPLALAVRAELAFWNGSWMSAFSDAWNAASLARESQQGALLPYALVTMARIESASGREPDAREHLETAARLAGELGHRSIAYWAESAMGFLELGGGRMREAALRLDRVVAAADEMGTSHPSALTWLGDLVEVETARGRRNEAACVAARLAQLAERTGGAWVTTAADRAQGVVSGGDGFERHFTDALASPVLAELPFERARTDLCFGERLRRADRGPDAARHLRSARVEFVRLGASPWVDRTDRELAACGEAPRRSTMRSSLDRLTPQELQVATAVAAGATNREAAEQLFLSRRTVEHHLGNVYRKLGIHSRMHLVRLMSDATR